MHAPRQVSPTATDQSHLSLVSFCGNAQARLRDQFCSGAFSLGRALGVKPSVLAGSLSPEQTRKLLNAFHTLRLSRPSDAVFAGAALLAAEKALQQGWTKECRDILKCILFGDIDGQVYAYARPRVLWLGGETLLQIADDPKTRKPSGLFDRATVLFGQAILNAERQNQPEVLMMASLGRALSRRRFARAEGVALGVQTGTPQEIESDLGTARKLAHESGEWRLEATALRELGRLETFTSAEAVSLFEEAIRIVEANAQQPELARRTAKICRSAVDRFFVTADLENTCTYAEKALSIPGPRFGAYLGQFREICKLLENVTAEFVVGCAILHYERKDAREGARILMELDELIGEKRIKRAVSRQQVLDDIIARSRELIKSEADPAWETWEHFNQVLRDLLFFVESEQSRPHIA